VKQRQARAWDGDRPEPLGLGGSGEVAGHLARSWSDPEVTAQVSAENARFANVGFGSVRGSVDMHAGAFLFHPLRVYDADARAFADSHGQQAPSDAGFEQFIGWPSFNPRLWRVAFDGDRIAGALAYRRENGRFVVFRIRRRTRPRRARDDVPLRMGLRFFGRELAGVVGNTPLDGLSLAARTLRRAHTYFWFYTGKDDPLARENRAFASELTAAGVPHKYLELRGGHNWALWRGMAWRSYLTAARRLGHP